SVVRASDIFVAIFVKATKRPGQIQAYPISADRRLLLGRQLFLRCIPSRLALFFRLTLPLHSYQARSLFLRTSRWLLLEVPDTVYVLLCSWSDGEARSIMSSFVLHAAPLRQLTRSHALPCALSKSCNA